MSEATQFFNNQKQSNALRLNTAAPCRVISYDESTRTAKIQPLFMTKEVGKEPKTPSPIENVPVSFQRYKLNNNESISISTDAGTHSQRSGSGSHNHNSLTFNQSVEMVPDLQKDDIVLVVFAQRALDNVKGGKVAYPSITRHHSKKDAMIVGILPI